MTSPRRTRARLAGVALGAALAASLAPAGLGAAAVTPTVSVSPDAGRLGVRVAARVSGFAPGRVVRIYLRDLAPAGSCVTGASGSCVAMVVVPSGPGGRYPVVARAVGESATSHFTKTPSLYASPVNAPAGTLLNAWPVGFEPREHVIVTLDGHAAGRCRTDQWGDCTVALTAAVASAGSHVLLARGLSSGLRVSATVTARG